jgi:hypothetical protein
LLCFTHNCIGGKKKGGEVITPQASHTSKGQVYRMNRPIENTCIDGKGGSAGFGIGNGSGFGYGDGGSAGFGIGSGRGNGYDRGNGKGSG